MKLRAICGQLGAGRSPPHTGGRGLKPPICPEYFGDDESPPHTGGRGLKLNMDVAASVTACRPLTRGGAD